MINEFGPLPEVCNGCDSRCVTCADWEFERERPPGLLSIIAGEALLSYGLIERVREAARLHDRFYKGKHLIQVVWKQEGGENDED